MVVVYAILLCSVCTYVHYWMLSMRFTDNQISHVRAERGKKSGEGKRTPYPAVIHTAHAYYYTWEGSSGRVFYYFEFCWHR